ncbi:MAG: hypothetical protein ACKO34_07050 [Vampirovibrionales bacterium]
MPQHPEKPTVSTSTPPWWESLWQTPWQHLTAHPFYRNSQTWLQHTTQEVKHLLQQPLAWLFTPSTTKSQPLKITFTLLPPNFVEHVFNGKQETGFTGHPNNRRNHERGNSRLVSVVLDPEGTHSLGHGVTASTKTDKNHLITLGDWFQACVQQLDLPTTLPAYTVSTAGLNPEDPAVRAWLTLRDAHRVPLHWKPTPNQLNQPLQRIELLQWYSHLQHLEEVANSRVYEDRGDSSQLWQAPHADPTATLNLTTDWGSYTKAQQQVLLLTARAGLLQQVFGLALQEADEVAHTSLTMHNHATTQEAERLLKCALPLPI